MRALDFTSGSSTDIYLRTIDRAYSTGTSLLDRGSSLYGGFDGEWMRDARRKASITGTDAGIAPRIESRELEFGPVGDPIAVAVEIGYANPVKHVVASKRAGQREVRTGSRGGHTGRRPCAGEVGREE